MRLTWAAAAGRLDLVGSPQPIKETHGSLLPQGVRTRVSSTGDTDALPWLLAQDWLNSAARSWRIQLNLILRVSTISNCQTVSCLSSAGSNCSSSSEGETTPTALHAGICVRQQSVSIKDAIIAREALSLLVTCLQLRCQQLSKSKEKCITTVDVVIILPLSIFL